MVKKGQVDGVGGRARDDSVTEEECRTWTKSKRKRIKQKKKKDENIAARKAREEAADATSMIARSTQKKIAKVGASISTKADAVLVPVPKTAPNVANIEKRKQSDSQDGNNKKARKFDTRSAAQGASAGPAAAATVTITATAKRRKRKKAAIVTSAAGRRLKKTTTKVVAAASNKANFVVEKRQQSDRQHDGDKRAPEMFFCNNNSVFVAPIGDSNLRVLHSRTIQIGACLCLAP
ncbi:unnamed protein product [Cylindrotheca closterium]|uniref:Uncharacterized protein n=1 Tax=Cylindrotheca closterium TaxID=2856 RepID=A0AAD2GCW3_9STRA|nr:unnamed protein product [Cylindrotheca closterium]